VHVRDHVHVRDPIHLRVLVRVLAHVCVYIHFNFLYSFFFLCFLIFMLIFILIFLFIFVQHARAAYPGTCSCSMDMLHGDMDTEKGREAWSDNFGIQNGHEK
jgi:fatty acid desaturase